MRMPAQPRRFRQLKIIALAAACVVAVIVAACLLVASRLDARALVQTVTATVKSGTGRELHVGKASIKLLPQPVIVLDDVRFANAAWGSQPWLAQAKRVTANIDLKRLVFGSLRIRHVELEDAAVLLETNRDGTGNWQLDSAADSPPSLEQLAVDGISLDELLFTYRNGVTDEVTTAKIEAAQITAAAGPGLIRVTALGKYNGKPVEVAGTSSTLASLVANERNFRIDLDGRIGVAEVGIHGAIEEPRALRGIDLKLSAQISEFADYIAQTGASVPKLGAFRGTARLIGTADAPSFSDIDMELGSVKQMKLAMRGMLSGKRGAGSTYDWESKGIDFTLEGEEFGDLSQWYGRRLPAWGQYRISGRIAGSAARAGVHALDAAFGGGNRPDIRVRGVIGDLRADRGIDVNVVASANDWWRSALVPDAPPLPPFRASARVRDAANGYRIDQLEVAVAGSSISASLSVISGGPRLRVNGKFASPAIDLSRIPQPPRAKANQAATKADRSQDPDHWKMLDAALDLKIGRLVLADGRQVQSLGGRVALDEGKVKASGLEFTVANSKIRLDGLVADPQRLAGFDLAVNLQGTELAELGKFIGRELPPAGPFQARARLRGAADAPALSDLDATIGRAGQSVSVSGDVEDAGRQRGLKLAVSANIKDSVAAGRLLGIDAPRLPPLRLTARVTGPQDGYVFDDVKASLGRSALQGRVVYAPGEPRPRVNANLSGTLVDLSELPPLQAKADAPNPLLAADIDAAVRFNRVVLPDRRTLGAVGGKLQLTAGTIELKEFAVSVEGASATLAGRIGDPLKPAQIDLAFSAQVANGNGLASFTGLRLGDLPAFNASGKLADNASGYALSAVKVTTSSVALAGDVGIQHGSKRLKITVKAAAPTIDLSPLVPAPEEAKPPAGARVISDAPLPLDVLRAVDGDFDFRFDSAKLGEAAPLGPLLVRATIADGVMKADQIQFNGKPGQSLSLAGSVDAATDAWVLRVKGNGIDFGELLTRFGRGGVVTGGSTDLALDFEGKGKSLAALMGSLTGSGWVKVGAFRIHNFAVPLDRGTIVHMFGLANPFVKADPDTEVRCFVARVPAKHGVFSSDRRVATETAKYNAVLSGTMNLRNEQLDLSVTPVVRGEVKTVIHIRGTLASPLVEVNAAGAIAKSAASAGATVATLGAWWLADTLLKNAAADKSPCATALGQ